MRRMLSILMAVVFLTVAGQAVAEEKKPLVVASTTQIADFSRQVGGDDVVVKSILAPGADPHTYQVTPDDVKILLAADLCLENGLHLEGKNWMATLAKDAGKTHATAHHLEHLQGRETADYLDETLGRPGVDPHGRTIPARKENGPENTACG